MSCTPAVSNADNIHEHKQQQQQQTDHTKMSLSKLPFSFLPKPLTQCTVLLTGQPAEAQATGFDSRKGINSSLPHHVNTGVGTHPASYPMGVWDFLTWDKAAGARS
jgi:alpha-D-ribose 1-methylphosphonate 5-triphosphate synthase subunit PhnH